VGLRFQRRIKILPGLRLNVSKTGISWTVGTRGASVNSMDGKLTGNVGLPGTGLSYQKRLGFPDSDPTIQDPPALHRRSGTETPFVQCNCTIFGQHLRE
jgi:hypothetical protein